MHRNASITSFLTIALALTLASLSGCATVDEGKGPVIASARLSRNTSSSFPMILILTTLMPNCF
jgi:hypothetical protein